jgi:hypothetical protein
VKRDLFIPVRDRRAGRRILTLRNAGKFALGLLVLVGLLALVDHFRKPASGDYGRLFGSRVAQPDLPKSRPVDVVTEQASPAVADQTAPDPMLLAPAAREQEVLGVTPAPASASATAVAPAAAATTTPLLQGGSDHVAIVGGSDGVAIVKNKTETAPKLRGGFGRQ